MREFGELRGMADIAVRRWVKQRCVIKGGTVRDDQCRIFLQDLVLTMPRRVRVFFEEHDRQLGIPDWFMRR